jgi:hypothetical protein
LPAGEILDEQKEFWKSIRSPKIENSFHIDPQPMVEFDSTAL